jgi:hypothetical protein
MFRRARKKGNEWSSTDTEIKTSNQEQIMKTKKKEEMFYDRRSIIPLRNKTQFCCLPFIYLFFCFVLLGELLAGIFASWIGDMAHVQIFTSCVRPQMSGDHITSTGGVRTLWATVGFFARVRPLMGAEMVGA